MANLFNLGQIKREPRLLILPLITFTKLWFSARLVKSVDNLLLYLVIISSDTMFMILLDKNVKTISFDQTGDESDDEVAIVDQSPSENVVLARNRVVEGDEENVNGEEEPAGPSSTEEDTADGLSSQQVLAMCIYFIALFMQLQINRNLEAHLKILMYLVFCFAEVYVLKYFTFDGFVYIDRLKSLSN